MPQALCVVPYVSCQKADTRGAVRRTLSKMMNRKRPYGFRWQSSEYLLQLLGHRTVPVEVGSNYLAQDWGQKMITFREFLRTAFPELRNSHTEQQDCTHANQNKQPGGSCNQCPIDTSFDCVEPDSKRHCPTSLNNSDAKRLPINMEKEPWRCSDAQQKPNDRTQGTDLLYLAQHSLCDQVRALRKDIMVRPLLFAVTSQLSVYEGLSHSHLSRVNRLCHTSKLCRVFSQKLWTKTCVVYADTRVLCSGSWVCAHHQCMDWARKHSDTSAHGPTSQYLRPGRWVQVLSTIFPRPSQ